ncbi:MAG: class III extradiol ring-cleavage dioxygenase [Bacillus sp. (in: firmicutes)]
MLPTYFIAHGAPSLAIENNDYTQFLEKIGNTIPKPKAIVLFSAHWESLIQKIGDVMEYETIYDFRGSSDALYQMTYPAKGESTIVGEIQALLKKEGISAITDTNRGLDHGAWVVVRFLYPNADIPVIAMSVNARLTPEEQYKIGKSLSILREKEILLVASGGTVHNLRKLKMLENQNEVDNWALEFDLWLQKHLEKWDTDSLFQYEELAPSARLAVPSYGREHFIPLFYAMGAADSNKKAKLLYRSYQYGNLSHSIWQFS